MEPTVKNETRKRVIVGWRQLARRVTENRNRQRTPPPIAKREA